MIGFLPHFVTVRKTKAMRKIFEGTKWKFGVKYPVISLITEQVMVNMVPQEQQKKVPIVPNGSIEFDGVDEDDEDAFDSIPKQAPVKVQVVKLLIANNINGEYLWFTTNEVRYSD